MVDGYQFSLIAVTVVRDDLARILSAMVVDTALLDVPQLPEVATGVPTLEDLERLQATDFYDELKAYSDDFLRDHARVLRGYGRHWGDDPMRLWSRRWEYPFVARGILAHADRTARDDLHCCDVGSGVTFLPYLLAERLPNARFDCCDTNASYGRIFDGINQRVEHDRVRFSKAGAQDLPYDNASLDVLACVSVLEHTSRYETIIREMTRVLRPDGRLLLTFDLSLDDKFELSPQSAKVVCETLEDGFVCDAGELLSDINRVLQNRSGYLTTDIVREREPEHLPWKYPRLQAVYDFARGYGITGGFRSVAVVCLDLAKR